MSKVKKYAIIAGAVAFVLIVSALALFRYVNKEKKRIENNLEIELRKEYSKQQEWTTKELKEYYEAELERLKEYNVRPKDIEHIVEVSYNYVDSVRYRDTLLFYYDTIIDVNVADFNVSANCIDIEGKILGDTIFIDRITNRDSIIVALYKEKKRCLFGKRTCKAIVYSSCANDTMAVLKNLHISR